MLFIENYLLKALKPRLLVAEELHLVLHAVVCYAHVGAEDEHLRLVVKRLPEYYLNNQASARVVVQFGVGHGLFRGLIKELLQ